MEKDINYYIKELWQEAQKQPYIDKKSFSCETHYTPSFKERQAGNFMRTEIKQIGAPRKNRTFI